MKSMTLKLGLPIALAGAITFGLCGAFPQVPKNKLMVEAKTNNTVSQKNIVKSKNSDVKDNEQKQKSPDSEIKEVKIAAAACENYLGLKIDRSEKNVEVKYDESQGRKECFVTFSNQPGAAVGDNYECTVDVNKEKVVQLRTGNNSKAVKNLSLQEAEEITTDFLNKSNLISGRKIIFKEKDMNDVITNPDICSKGTYQYAFCMYDDNNNNYLTITIDKSTKKVVGFFFYDTAFPGLG